MITIRSNRSSSSTTGSGGKLPQQQQQQTTVAPTTTTTTTPTSQSMNGQTDRRNNHHYDDHYYGYGDKKPKYGGNKNRGMTNGKHIPHEFVMLQRPTILVKPASEQTEQFNRSGSKQSVNVIDVKDENLKPVDATTTPTTITINGTKTKPIVEQKNADVNHKNALTLNKNGINLTPQSVVLNPITPALIKQQQQQQQQQPVISRDLHSKAEESKQAPAVVATSAVSKSVNGSVKSFIESINNRLSTLPYMTHSVKLLDDNLQWHDSLGEYLQDQNDFLVVGFLGKTGTGKSSLASLLAGGTLGKKDTFVFADNNNDSAHHQTSGINAFVTTERTIFLDVQPLLSCSILDRAINGSTDTKKHLNVDFKYYENYIELQSIELTCFILSVCNVVILADDWFIDPNLFRLLHTAEMLLPNLNSPTSGGSSSAQILLAGEEANSHFEHHPHLIYLLNKCEYTNRRDVLKMKSLIDVLMTNSKLMYKGSINDLTLMNNISSVGAHMMSRPHGNHNKSKRNLKHANASRSTTTTDGESINAEAVNLVLMPKFDADKKNASKIANDNDLNTVEFNGLPSVDKSVNALLREILAVRRTNCSFITTNGSTATNANSAASQSTNNNSSRGQILTEKKWFVYANKVWDTIRKSPFIAEYNRLMT